MCVGVRVYVYICLVIITDVLKTPGMNFFEEFLRTLARADCVRSLRFTRMSTYSLTDASENGSHVKSLSCRLKYSVGDQPRSALSVSLKNGRNHSDLQ